MEQISRQADFLQTDRNREIRLPEETPRIVKESPQRNLAATDLPLFSDQEDKVEQPVLREYILQAGDRIGTIARQYGLKESSIISLNQLHSPADLTPGMVLFIPPWDGSLLSLGRRETPLGYAMDHQIEPGKYITLSGEREYFMPLLKNTDYFWEHVMRLPLAGAVLQGYGPYMDPLTEVETAHTGIDIEGKEGEPVLSVEKGRVVETGFHSFYGRYMILSHPRGYQSFYGHLESFELGQGSQVEKGQVIAMVGKSGQTQRRKLHFSLFLNEKTVDPMDFLY